MSLEQLSESRCFGGVQRVYRHASKATGTSMEFSAYIPDSATGRPAPVLFFLSGLTCTWENFTIKAGAQRHAAEHGVVIIVPDTSPRGPEIADEDGYFFGTGAGFYLDATVEPWAKNYRMYDYVAHELPELVAAQLPCDLDRAGIFGHSMGGHGALTIAFKNPDRFRSVSALAPIVAPMHGPWGQRAFTGYLGEDREAWKEYDACELVRARGWTRDILIDQGTADQFLEKELLLDRFVAACAQEKVSLTARMQEGYDHTYYFIATFIGDHVAWHAKRLGDGG